MKIVKLAQGVPAGYVKLRITVGNKGEFKAQFVRDGATQCHEGSGAFLEDLMNTSVAGFGDTFEGNTPSKTEEYWEQNRPKVTPPVGVETSPEDDVVTRRPERRLDQQFGV
jgi:hypothetical protein